MNNYKEKYRPQFHFTPDSHWMNDPNGMVYFDEEYHLFYQYHPHDTVWGPMHWGHAVSKDLVHWEHLPIALAPDEHGFIFSGSAVVDKHDTTGFFAGGSGLVAIFTHADTDEQTGLPRQRQSLAYSLDKGRSWIKYENNPVLAEPELIDFRDPKVWWDEAARSWRMVIAAGDHLRFYQSNNLKDWTYTGEFGKMEGSHDGVWECPDLIPLPVEGLAEVTKWLLIVSIGDQGGLPEGSRTQYFVGEFDGKTFVNDEAPEHIMWLDHGRDNYAGVTWSNVPAADGRCLYIGWMSNWKYATLTPTKEWRSAMTVPRELSLYQQGGRIRARQTPISELRKLRVEKHTADGFLVTPSQEGLSSILAKGALLEMIVEFEQLDAMEFGLKLKTSESEQTVVGYEPLTNSVFIDRTKAGDGSFHPSFACKHGAKLPLTKNRIKLHVFVDASSIEVFVNDGKLVMTDLIFPQSDNYELEIYSVGGDARVLSLEVHRLSPIYSQGEMNQGEELHKGACVDC